ncbi:hypothetical protein CCHR01_14375 [Colletotrichum chrysophilum]|uniref:Uncharacterized protein n=1 Tax=Colletotrichum chrysophilum TaxID=1836956 RepID=A0AAD9A8P4_9PEZI|nr:hypothetical protein CCHR01_14375 [Colletotrichum chrysophilum]
MRTSVKLKKEVPNEKCVFNGVWVGMCRRGARQPLSRRQNGRSLGRQVGRHDTVLSCRCWWWCGIWGRPAIWGRGQGGGVAKRKGLELGIRRVVMHGEVGLRRLTCSEESLPKSHITSCLSFCSGWWGCVQGVAVVVVVVVVGKLSLCVVVIASEFPLKEG